MAENENMLGIVGECSIEQASLLKFNDNSPITEKTVDLRYIIARYSILESITSPVMDIMLEITDTVGLLENFPIIGEERIMFTIRDVVSNVKVDMDLAVVGVENILPHPNGFGYSYTLACVSTTSFKSMSRKVVAPFSKTASEIAKDVFKNTYDKLEESVMGDSIADRVKIEAKELLFGDNGGSQKYEILNMVNDKTKNFTVEYSDVEVRCVIPNMYANEAMLFIAERSVNTTTNVSSSYNFFETKFSYFFATNELLINQAISEVDGKKVKKMTYNTSYDISPEKTKIQAEKIKQIQILSYVNTISDIRSGAYNSKINEIDVIYGRILPIEFGYKESKEFFGGMGKKGVNGGEIHTEEFLNTIFVPENTVEWFRMKNYDSFNNIQIQGEQFYGEKILRNNAYNTRLNSTTLRCIIDGRLDLAVGDVVELNIDEMNSDEGEKKLSPRFSGSYFVREVKNSVIHGKLETTFDIVKYGWER